MKNALKKTLKNERGSSLIAALFIVMAMGIAGMELVQATVSEGANSSNSLQSANALYIGQAGLEYARDLIASGSSPNVPNHPFYNTDGTQIGSFTITPDYVNNRVTVVSNSGLASDEQSMDVPFASTCTEIVTTNVQHMGNLLRHLGLQNNCGRAVVMTHFQLQWSWTAYPTESAFIAMVPFNNTKIYKPSIGIGGLPASGGALNNVEIDVVDINLPDDGLVHELEFFDAPNNFTFGILFSNLPGGFNQLSAGTYTAKVTYGDGSSNTKSFTVL